MTRTHTPLIIMLLVSPGCSTNSVDWFDPDWDRVIDRSEATRDSIEDARVPTPELPAADELVADAAGRVELSVEQVVVRALGRNRDLAVAQLEPVISGAFELVERGRFDPEVFADFEYSRREAIEVARSTQDQFSVRSDRDDLVGGVRTEIPTGTEVEVFAGTDRDASNRSPRQRSSRVGLTVTQSLLRGMGPAVNLVDVRVAELDTRASEQELRGFTESVLAEAEIAYWRYLLALRTIEIVERSLEVERKQAAEIEERIEVGVLAETEVSAIRAEVALREQALIDARSELRARRLELARVMDYPFDAGSELEIVPVSLPGLGDAPAFEDEASRVSLALLARPDLAESRTRLEQDRLETVRTRNGLLPRLDAFVAFAKTGYAETFRESFLALDESAYDFSVGVSFSQSIGRDEARGLYEASLATRQQAALAVRNLEQLVELEVRLALNDARRAREQIGASATTRRLQRETVDAELQRFEAGASTALLVAQAQRDLLAAEINEVEALVGFRIALVRLYLAEGSLLDRRGVVTSGA